MQFFIYIYLQLGRLCNIYNTYSPGARMLDRALHERHRCLYCGAAAGRCHNRACEGARLCTYLRWFDRPGHTNRLAAVTIAL